MKLQSDSLGDVEVFPERGDNLADPLGGESRRSAAEVKAGALFPLAVPISDKLNFLEKRVDITVAFLL